jgi:uncharacterized protein (TIGR03083 family)
MTMTTTATAPPRTSQLERKVAMRLAADEYQHFIELLRSLTPQQWAAPTNCPPWDVRAMATHLLGMAEMVASVREQGRQTKTAGLHAAQRSIVFIDALTALQVDEHKDLSPADVIARFEKVAPKAAKGRKRAPFFIRRRTLPVPQQVNGQNENWTIGYMLDVILTRDPFMHRIDIADAIGVPPVHTAAHDGVIIDDVVREWAARHGQPVTLRLTGPAGGIWTFGNGSAELEMDVPSFCRALSGRIPATGLLTTEVPF